MADNKNYLSFVDWVPKIVLDHTEIVEERRANCDEGRAKSVDIMDLIADKLEAMPPHRTEVVKCPHCQGAKPADDICPYCELG